MAQFHVIAGARETPDHPTIRKISLNDLVESLNAGIQDFMAMPSHLVFLGLLYPILGVCLAALTFTSNALPLLFPLMSGFALVGPFAAIGLYEISRRRELGLEATWRHALDVLSSPSIPSIVALGVVLMTIFVVWLFAAQALYESLFGPLAPSCFRLEGPDALPDAQARFARDAAAFGAITSNEMTDREERYWSRVGR